MKRKFRITVLDCNRPNCSQVALKPSIGAGARVSSAAASYKLKIAIRHFKAPGWWTLLRVRTSALRFGCGFAALFLLSALLASVSVAGANLAATKSALDLTGKLVDPFQNITNKAVVLIFVGRECPISNGYAPEIRRLSQKFAAPGVKFWLVYPSSDDIAELIRQHTREYQLELDVLRDPQHTLVKRAKATVTPEVAVFVPGGRMVYHGRIDDRNVALGKQRPEATEHDLERALEAIRDGKKPRTSFRKPVGCYISER
jgi:hypothetical protein